MSKEFEALERLAMPDELHIKECKRLGIGLTEDYELIKQRLEAIDNANPSEALECLGVLETYFYNKWKLTYFLEDKPKELNTIDTIKQALLKAQELEKENAEYKQLEEEIGCPLEVFLKALGKGFYCPKNLGGKEFVLSSNNYQTQKFKNINDEWTISLIDSNVVVASIHLKDYKKTWWLRKDKSE